MESFDRKLYFPLRNKKNVENVQQNITSKNIVAMEWDIMFQKNSFSEWKRVIRNEFVLRKEMLRNNKNYFEFLKFRFFLRFQKTLQHMEGNSTFGTLNIVLLFIATILSSSLNISSRSKKKIKNAKLLHKNT